MNLKKFSMATMLLSTIASGALADSAQDSRNYISVGGVASIVGSTNSLFLSNMWIYERLGGNLFNTEIQTLADDLAKQLFTEKKVSFTPNFGFEFVYGRYIYPNMALEISLSKKPDLEGKIDTNEVTLSSESTAIIFGEKLKSAFELMNVKKVGLDVEDIDFNIKASQLMFSVVYDLEGLKYKSFMPYLKCGAGVSKISSKQVKANFSSERSFFYTPASNGKSFHKTSFNDYTNNFRNNSPILPNISDYIDIASVKEIEKQYALTYQIGLGLKIYLNDSFNVHVSTKLQYAPAIEIEYKSFADKSDSFNTIKVPYLNNDYQLGIEYKF